MKMTNHSNTSEEQFIIYHKRLRNELDTAYAHYEIAKSLRDFSQTRRSEFNEAQSFFELTLIANLFVTVMVINRFIDKRRDCLRLNSFFKLIKGNLDIFSTSALQRRLESEGMSKEDIDGKVGSHIEITDAMVDEDERTLASLPTENLKCWRDNVLAHK